MDISSITYYQVEQFYSLGGCYIILSLINWKLKSSAFIQGSKKIHDLVWLQVHGIEGDISKFTQCLV